MADDSAWVREGNDAPLVGNSAQLNDHWMMENGLIGYSDMFSSNNFNSPTNFYNGPAFQFQDSMVADYSNMPNALGLDPFTAAHNAQTYTGTHMQSFHPSEHPSPSHGGRLPLPQIKTTDLRASPNHFLYPRSPADMFVDSSTGPRSALTSCSPSTAGHSTLLMTPASLPAQSQLSLPYVDGSHLSPSSPYRYPSYRKSPSPPKSPYSPYLAPHTPSSAEYSPAEGSASPYNLPRLSINANAQTHPTVYELAGQWPNLNKMIPQKPYRPHTQSDRRRYVEEVELEGPIMFYMANPAACGIPLKDAVNCKFARLDGRDDQMFVQCGPSISIRLMWPGYVSWSRQIPTRDFRSPPGPITRSKLAKNVAKTIQRFIDEMKTRPMEDADPRWKVGIKGINIDDLELVGLQHVSKGSWQAHLRLRNGHT
ncbi:hypothetical protein PHLCEN_2v2439 [Hermanssonia centrifuga]|uniref:Uncharacterized protein n=1 Tax=Hermanssonia centrifuga TaxID=98765 RepID=A0A2R6RLX6_9APHY|nr:hypothetical protein PHLCEN_2v2439 [Hermanssonia centrifuga]